MSDFLSNLVARSLGTLEVVQPRVPSLYEPHHRESGLRGARPGFSAPEAATSNENSLEGDTNAPPLSPRVEGSERREPAGPVAPTRTDRDEIRPGPITSRQVSTQAGPRPESNLPSNVPHGTLDPTLRPASTEPAGISPAISSESNIAAGKLNRTRLFSEAEVSPRLVLAHPLHSRETETDPGRDRSQPATPSGHSYQPLATHPAAFPKHAIRPPVAPRSAAARNPEARQSSSPNNSTIEVTIGRVEVRAVFPEPPARRAPPPRSRPTVSLDDYLNPRHRGKR